MSIIGDIDNGAARVSEAVCNSREAGYAVGMSWEKLVEQKIQEAMAEGEFDDLPGKGKPLDLSAYFATPEEVRVSNSILKNAGIVPQEVELLGEIAKLKADLEACADEARKKEIRASIDELTLKYNLLMEHSKGSGRRRS